MREILFRGKTSSGKWVYGNYAESNQSMITGKKPHKAWIVTGFTSNGGWITPFGRYPVDESTVGQYTGLKDRNGNRIFEGDIVKSVESGAIAIVQWFEEHAAFMLWVKTANYVDYLGEVNSSIISIIGNIHDNTELLKGESET